MDKTIHLNEKTLEQEKESFKLICKVFEVACIVLLITFAVIAALVVVLLAVNGAALNDVIVLLLNSAVLLLGMSDAVNFGRAIFRSLKSGETPFRYDIADKVKGAALALIGSGVLGILVQSLSHIFSEAFADICHYYFLVAVGGCFTGILLGMVSYIMSYGCKLQQESDETI